jgi:hypothetical protein
MPAVQVKQSCASLDSIEKNQFKSQYLASDPVLVSTDLDKVVTWKKQAEDLLRILDSGNLCEMEKVDRNCCLQNIIEYIDQILALQKTINASADKEDLSLQNELSWTKSRFKNVLADILSH